MLFSSGSSSFSHNFSTSLITGSPPLPFSHLCQPTFLRDRVTLPLFSSITITGKESIYKAYGVFIISLRFFSGFFFFFFF